MNKQITMLALMLAVSTEIEARTLSIAPSPNITRNAGQSIPLVFTAAGFAPGSLVQIWFYNAHTWQGNVIEADVPVQNGVNNHPVIIPWSQTETGPFVIRLVAGATVCWDSKLVTVRTSIIYPYSGTAYYAGYQASISWVVGNWDLGQGIGFTLRNEDTGENYSLDYTDNPYSGQYTLELPPDVTGNHFRIYLDAVYIIEEPSLLPDEESQSYVESVQSTRTAVISIK
jgi:hypothetical protein